jgi:hypothetical protein
MTNKNPFPQKCVKLGHTISKKMEIEKTVPVVVIE